MDTTLRAFKSLSSKSSSMHLKLGSVMKSVKDIAKGHIHRDAKKSPMEYAQPCSKAASPASVEEPMPQWGFFIICSC